MYLYHEGNPFKSGITIHYSRVCFTLKHADVWSHSGEFLSFSDGALFCSSQWALKSGYRFLFFVGEYKFALSVFVFERLNLNRTASSRLQNGPAWTCSSRNVGQGCSSQQFTATCTFRRGDACYKMWQCTVWMYCRAETLLRGSVEAHHYGTHGSHTFGLAPELSSIVWR